METENGFILTRHAVDRNGRCELHYYGRSDSGPFRIVITPHAPLFFVRKDDAAFPHSASLPPLIGMDRREVPLESFEHAEVDALYFTTLNDYYNARKELREHQIKTYESDVRPADRYIMERFINSSVEISGERHNEGAVTVWTNPRMRPAEYSPEFNWLSIDIETGSSDPGSFGAGTAPLYSIAMHGTFGSHELKRVFVVGESPVPDSTGKIGDIGALSVKPIILPTEKDILIAFIKELKTWDPDLIIGWHVIGFDLKFLVEKCALLQIPFSIGRGNRAVRISSKRSGIFSVDLEGRVVIDGPQNMRMGFFKFEDFTLETVAQSILGRGKDIRPEEEKVQEITRRFLYDKEALARYNLEDCVLVTEIFKKTGLIEQIKARSLITGLTMDRISMSVASFDHAMLPGIHRKGYVAPETDDVFPGGHAAGGYVFTSLPGLYHHVVVLDFKSLYPTIIRTFSIDPYSRLSAETDTVTTPNGINFSRTHHILPEFLKNLMEKREQAKKRHDPYLSTAIKILMNSFYGVMGTTGCRFYHADLPTAITETGQWVLKGTAEFIRNQGYNVIYGDTDSVFVALKENEQLHPEKAGTALMKQVNTYFTEKIVKEFGVESMLEMEFEKHYEKFFLPAKRSSTEGSKKRYAGLLADGTIEYKGLEVIRSDWTELAKQFQQELFSRFFQEQEIRAWIKLFVKRLRDGEMDDLLVYRKRLRRSAEQYEKTTPPHIKAVRMLDPEGVRHLREISYIMTSRGAVPIEMEPKDIDYRHYVDKQIKPLADGVLFAINDSFDAIIDGRQLELFSQAP
ncbi:MAG: DNA polymerase II [Bacteroidetes bacterium]|nr:DNA polymerase II [Bacteroidota bacterium]